MHKRLQKILQTFSKGTGEDYTAPDELIIEPLQVNLLPLGQPIKVGDAIMANLNQMVGRNVIL